MRTARSDRFAMTRLSGDLPAASMLAAVLLIVQILIAGLSVGTAHAGIAERHLCTAAPGAGDARGGNREHGPACPCLAAGCCATPASGAPPEGVQSLLARSLPVFVIGGLQARAEPERRPLQLFARAGRGPPRDA